MGPASNWNRKLPSSDRPRISTGLLGTVQFGTADGFQIGLLSK